MKNELRKKYKLLRKTLSEDQKDDFSNVIFNKCASKFNLEDKNISIFLPINKFNEINTWHFLDNLNGHFYVPVVQNKILRHIKFENKAQLKTSDWGILEPSYGEEVNPKKFDFVIVPLLAYDFKGNRIGYGAGYYDSFLKKCNANCIFIGVSFFEPESNLFETYPTDIPIQYCVTPHEIHEF